VAKIVKKPVRKKVVESKAVAKKALPKSDKPEKPLTAKEIEHFKELLLIKRRELIGDVNSMEDEAMKKSRLDAAGDLSSMPIHMADIGTDNYEQEFALNLLDSERKLLRLINDALDRIVNNVYGLCEGTGEQIPRSRLEAKPWAQYCIEYTRMVERGLVSQSTDNTSNTDDKD